MDYAKKARKLGWIFDEGGRHWFKPSETPFRCPGQYAKTAKEACQLDWHEINPLDLLNEVSR